MKCRTALPLALLLCCACFTTPTQSAELFLMSYNVENLFDTQDDPQVDKDEEFTPSAPKKWTNERFSRKLNNLARVIKSTNNGRGPDILGLIEVENRYVIEQLLTYLMSLKRNYKIVHRDSPSARGIDCAIIYDANKLTLKHSDFIHVATPGPTRDIVEAEFELAGRRLHVFENHWPSRGSDESARIKAADTQRKRIDELLSQNAAADIVVMGDLNDYPPDISVRKRLNAVSRTSELTGRALLNTTWPIHDAPNQGTYVYRDKWGVLDHVIVSQGLLDNRGFTWKPGSTSPVRQSYQIFTPNNSRYQPRPNRSYSGDKYHSSGTSDHLPISCILTYQAK